MIFYMPKEEAPSHAIGWIPMFMPVTESLMKKFKVRINGKVYTEFNEEVEEAYKADLAWDRLMYREPGND